MSKLRETLVWREGHGLVPKSRAREIDAENSPVKAFTFEFRRVERGSWVFRNGRLIPKSEAQRGAREQAMLARSALPAPAVHMDGMNEFVSHVDGKTVIDSKKKWERHVKEAGYEIVGNDQPSKGTKAHETKAYRDEVKKDIALAMEKLEQGWTPPPEESAADSGITISPGSDGYVRADGDVAALTE